ncbi:carboxypeptidase B-like isoform X2 [Leptopilina boulardi]|uniref:carboxypeptidase B-like isoform X2 n=1 Tax=Leptopilina boulardi TaxID=63433 RepID=UPI0021F5C8F4|nr:carboxypeptidase B-like isoform X2 [Leptopilina boulardi]
MEMRFVLISTFLIQLVKSDKYLSCLKGMQGISISCDSEEKLNLILRYQKQKGFDFMRIVRFPQIIVEVLVKASKVPNFKKELETHRIQHQVFIRDLQKIVEIELNEQQEFEPKNGNSRRFNNTFSFNYFPRYQTIKNFLDSITKRNRDVTLLELGTSTEKREMYGVKISSGGRNKPSIVIDAGIHGREWIAPVTALFAINELVQVHNKHLYKNVDWYIIPLLNPDGYEFSHTKNRLWKKTRSKTRGSLCRGVDGNKNFDFMWMETGASNDPCDAIYAGSKSFSEPETRNFRNFIQSGNKNIKVYISLHSYGKFFLHPWGYTEKLPKNEPTLRKVAQEAADALAELHGTQYIIGSSSTLLYPSSGGSDDWMMAMGDAELSFSIELPGSSFISNSSKIKPVGQEIFEALKFFAKFAEVGIKHG